MVHAETVHTFLFEVGSICVQYPSIPPTYINGHPRHSGVDVFALPLAETTVTKH